MEGGKFVKVDGTDFELEADLVLLAMGFVGPEREGLLTDLGVELTDRGNVARDDDYATNVPGVFVAGDMGRGQSLIVWAIAEGRAAAAAVDNYLMGVTALCRHRSSRRPHRSDRPVHPRTDAESHYRRRIHATWRLLAEGGNHKLSTRG